MLRLNAIDRDPNNLTNRLRTLKDRVIYLDRRIVNINRRIEPLGTYYVIL